MCYDTGLYVLGTALYMWYLFHQQLGLGPSLSGHSQQRPPSNVAKTFCRCYYDYSNHLTKDHLSHISANRVVLLKGDYCIVSPVICVTAIHDS